MRDERYCGTAVRDAVGPRSAASFASGKRQASRRRGVPWLVAIEEGRPTISWGASAMPSCGVEMHRLRRRIRTKHPLKPASHQPKTELATPFAEAAPLTRIGFRSRVSIRAAMRTSMTVIYYIRSDKEKRGPFDLSALKQLRAAGLIDDQTLVCGADETSWAPYSSLPFDLPENGETAESHAAPPRVGDITAQAVIGALVSGDADNSLASRVASSTPSKKEVIAALSIALVLIGLACVYLLAPRVEMALNARSSYSAPSTAQQASAATSEVMAVRKLAGPVVPAGTTICVDQRSVMRYVAMRGVMQAQGTWRDIDGCEVLGSDAQVRVLRTFTSGPFDLALVGNTGGSVWVAADELRH